MEKVIIEENKKLERVTGYKEPFEIMLLLETVKSVWDSDAAIFISNTGVPILSGWYKEMEDSEKIHVEYMYKNDKWNLIQKYTLK